MANSFGWSCALTACGCKHPSVGGEDHALTSTGQAWTDISHWLKIQASRLCDDDYYVAAAGGGSLHANQQGSIIAVADSTGTAIALNAYDAYGIPSPTNLGRFAYTGQIMLPELGLYYYKARLYSPTLGRFLQTDPPKTLAATRTTSTSTPM